MEKKITETIHNVCTLLGAGLMLFPLIDEATKTLIPEMEKLKSGEALQELKALPAGEDKKDVDTSERDTESKKKDDEISELKKKLAELESKSDVQSQQ